MFVKPSDPDLLVPVPGVPVHARWLPADGAEVPDDEYWRRRLADGEVVQATPPAEPEPDAEAEPPAAPPRTAKPRKE